MEQSRGKNRICDCSIQASRAAARGLALQALCAAWQFQNCDCFHEGPNFLVIDPEECIDCTLCEPECPIEAIVSEDDIPEGQEQFLELNEELSQAWPVITVSKPAPDDATEWEGVPDKLQYLER